MEIWPGYKASSYIYNTGIFLVLESINKFFRKESCLDKIQSMLYTKRTQEEIDEYFQSVQVMTDWGSKRAYNIAKVRMDMNPVNAKFELEGHSVTVKEYFKEKYNIDLDP